MGLRDLLFPPRCAFCGRLSGLKAGEICPDCREKLRPYLEGDRHSEGEFFEDCVSPLRYGGIVRKSFHRFKFGGRRGYRITYARLMAPVIREEYEGEYDLLSWVPVNTLRRWKRGYDQTELLAKALGEELGIKPVPLLKKIRNTPAQSSLQGEAERRANALGAYRALHSLHGERVLLIDDVVTSGSTLGECSRMLLMAGAESVLCAALARGGGKKT